MQQSNEYTIRYRGTELTMAVNDPEDVVQIHHVRGQFYEIEELEYIRTLLPPKTVAVDVGANVGNHSLFFGKICKAARVIPFEVNEEAIALLKKNVALNCADMIELNHVGCAVGAGKGFVRKSIEPTHNLGATTFVRTETDNGYRVDSLDALLTKQEVDFLKIDVEGMEFEVLAGAAETIQENRPILFVEVRRRDLDRYYSVMRKMNYRTERTFQRYKGVFTFLAVHGR
jgi:FkbM family methyltransferase